MRYCSGDTLIAVRDFIYDDSGNLKEQVYKTNMSEQVFTDSYNENGQLSYIVWDSCADYEAFNIVDTYDAQGNLIREEKTRYSQNTGEPLEK